jgi:lipase chaperone LimK
MKEKRAELLRWDEAIEVLRSIENPITSQLMNIANFEVLKRFLQSKEFPVADFDLRFFMEVMRDFCSDHETLRKVLDGEDLRLFSDDFQNDEKKQRAVADVGINQDL